MVGGRRPQDPLPTDWLATVYCKWFAMMVNWMWDLGKYFLHCFDIFFIYCT